MKKTGIIFICSLLISSTTSFAITSSNTNQQLMKNNFFDAESFQMTFSEGWLKTFGGTDVDHGESVQQTTDGGYIITGPTCSFGAGSSDVWLIKTDANGNKLWDKTFGGKYIDGSCSVQQTSDGGYIIIGYTCSLGAGSYDFWLIKTDANGNKLWDKTFGGTNLDIGHSIQQTIDMGYIITGETYLVNGDSTNCDVWLIKTDKNGNIEWNRTFDRTYWDWGSCVQQTSDAGYIIIGNTYTFDYNRSNMDIWLIKTDYKGIEEWNRIFGEKGNDEGYSVRQTTDSGYILIGETESFDAGSSDVWLIKADNNGYETWNRTFGGTSFDSGYSVQQTTDQGYIMTGYTRSFGAGICDIWLVKADNNGYETWNRTFGGNYFEAGYSVQQTSDGGYIITGETYSLGAGSYDVWLIKTDSQGIANDPPEKPKITGETNGKPGKEYVYTFISTDPEKDQILYYIDWGDNTLETIIGPYESDVEALANHIWFEKGNYTINAKAIDVYCFESDWVTFKVSIAKSKSINTPLFLQKLFDCFPLFEKILKPYYN